MCIDLHQTESVGEGSDHLQLIKFWPSCAQGRGLRRAEILGSALRQPARSVCVSLSAFFIYRCFDSMRDVRIKPSALQAAELLFGNSLAGMKARKRDLGH